MNKKIKAVIIAEIAVLLVVVIGLICLVAAKPKNPEPTNPPTQAPTAEPGTTQPTTIPDGFVENPFDKNPEATADSSNPTNPSENPTQPSDGPTDPVETQPTDPALDPTEPTDPTDPTEPTEPIDYSSMDYETYMSLSSKEQEAFQDSFDSLTDFIKWFNAAKAEYDAQEPTIDMGDGNIDIGDLIGGGNGNE